MTKDRAKTAYPISFPLDVPATWTPYQALAVFELITDLRDKIWAAYAPQIQDVIQNERHQSALNDICGDFIGANHNEPL